MSANQHHTVTLTFDGGYIPTTTWTCTAPPDALCHAVWDCDCESWVHAGVTDEGVPWHSWEDVEDPLTPTTERHTGTFGDECALGTWWDASGEPLTEVLHGSITFPVRAAFENDYYTFEPVGPGAANGDLT